MTVSILRIGALVLGVVAVGSMIAWWILRSESSAHQQPLGPSDFLPPGVWQRVPPDRHSTSDEDRHAEERARLLSLPYVAGGTSAGPISGVILHEPDRAMVGVNLYVSGHGPEAFLLDMDGARLHRWFYPFRQAFPERGRSNLHYDWRRVAWRGDGGLVVLVQAGGIFAIDADSQLQWALDRGVYNDLQLLPNGETLVVTKRSRSIPGFADGREILEDRIEFIDAQGRVRTEISLLDALRTSDYAYVLDPLPVGSDILHTNTVELIDGKCPSIFLAGQLLVSFREIDTIAVVDPESAAVVWAQRGPWARQHQPTIVEEGRILLFDNRGRLEDGAAKRSRILEIEPASGAIVWSFEREGFYSHEGGSVQRLSNGNTLITSSEQGAAFEVQRDGTIVWEFVSPHRAGSNLELVANLWEMIRIEHLDTRVFD